MSSSKSHLPIGAFGPDIIQIVLGYLSGCDQVALAAAIRAYPPSQTLLDAARRDADVARIVANVWELSFFTPANARFNISSPIFHEENAAVLEAILPSRPVSLDASYATLGWSALNALARCCRIEKLVLANARLNRLPRRTWACAGTLRILDMSSARLPLDWSATQFCGLEEYSGAMSQTLLSSLAVSCPRLHAIALLGVRVCELRIDGGSWHRVLSRLTSLRFEHCDLLPRAHLLQDAGAVLQVWDVLKVPNIASGVGPLHPCAHRKPSLPPPAYPSWLSCTPRAQRLRVLFFARVSHCDLALCRASTSSHRNSSTMPPSLTALFGLTGRRCDTSPCFRPIQLLQMPLSRQLRRDADF